jgi:predicted peroxiredoxin
MRVPIPVIPGKYSKFRDSRQLWNDEKPVFHAQRGFWFSDASPTRLRGEPAMIPAMNDPSRRGIAAMIAALFGIGIARAQTPANGGEIVGAASAKKFLVHIHTGPENPTKAALGFLVALTAKKQGHSVGLFLAGDAAYLITDTALRTVQGLGTGSLAAHFGELSAAGVRFHISGMSARARGLNESDLAGKPAEFAPPDTLVKLAAEADVVVTY